MGGLKPGPVSSKTEVDCSPFGIGYAFYLIYLIYILYKHNNKLH